MNRTHRAYRGWPITNDLSAAVYIFANTGDRSSDGGGKQQSDLKQSKVQTNRSSRKRNSGSRTYSPANPSFSASCRAQLVLGPRKADNGQSLRSPGASQPTNASFSFSFTFSGTTPHSPTSPNNCRPRTKRRPETSKSNYSRSRERNRNGRPWSIWLL